MVVNLYQRTGSGSERTLCEWCGRPAEILPVKITGGELEVCEPSLCQICQGLLGIAHPYRGQRAESRQESEEQQLALWSDARHAVWRLLAARYAAEGRPPPTWESPSIE